MNPSDLLNNVANRLATDGRSLDDLKRAARSDPQAAVKKAAQQFEALFMQMVLKSMRDAVPKSGMFDSSAEQMFTGMLDQQLATKVASSGTGLADVIAKQLARYMPAQKAPTDAAPADAAKPAANSNVSAAVRRTAIEAFDAVKRLQPAELSNTPSADSKPNSKQSFIERVMDYARAAQKTTGIAAPFVVAQAALESAWGRREIRGADGAPSHNLFGIKAGANWQGRTVDVVTTEYENGVAKKVVEKFRAYDSYADAFRDWAKLIGNNPRYAAVKASGDDAQAYAAAMQRSGYATDPRYGDKLARVIESVSRATNVSSS